MKKYKLHLLSIMITLTFCIGCMPNYLSREYLYTHEDEGRFVMKIRYKPKRHIVDGREVGEYYFKLRHIPTEKSIIYAKYEKNRKDAERHLRQTGRANDLVGG